MKRKDEDIEYRNLGDGVISQSVGSSTFIFTSSFTGRGFTSSLAFPKINTSYKCRCGCCPGCGFSPTTEGIVIVAMSSFYSLPCFPPVLNTFVKATRGRVFLSLYFLETVQKIYEARDRLSSPKEGLPHPFPLPQSFKGTDRGEGHHETGRS